MPARPRRRGFSLLQIEELSQKLGLYFQMAFREKDAAFVVPSVVHLKVEHFAAITRQEGDRYLLQDPTFGNDAWVTERDARSRNQRLFPHSTGRTSATAGVASRRTGKTSVGARGRLGSTIRILTGRATRPHQEATRVPKRMTTARAWPSPGCISCSSA